MEDDRFILTGSDGLMGAADQEYTFTVTTAEAFAIRDAVTCLAMAATGQDANEHYADYARYGFFDEAHRVADRLTILMRPTTAKVGKYIRMIRDSMDRRN